MLRILLVVLPVSGLTFSNLLLASISISTAPVGFSGVLALPAAGSTNYYSTQVGGKVDNPGVGTIAWSANSGSTWEIRIYTSNSNNQGGLQSEIASDQFLPLKYTTTPRGALNADVTDGAVYEDVNIYSFISDDNFPRIFARSGVEDDVVAGLDFRFATAIADSEIGGIYSTDVIFELLVDL